MLRTLTLLLLSATAAAAVRPAAASELPSPLTLEAAITAARDRNPDIRAAQARYLAMRERPIQAGTLPDPTLGVTYHNEDWDNTFGESEFSFVEVTAEQEIPFPGKLGHRARIAEHAAERERAMRDMTVLMTLANVATSYADLAVTERSEEILRDNTRLLALMIDQANARYGVGEAAQQDVLRATLELGALEERLTMLARQRKAAAAALAALLDLHATQSLPATAPLPAPALLEPLDSLNTRLATGSPPLRAAAEDLLGAREALRLARREYYPDFAVMGGYMNKERLLPEWELGVRVNIPLYFWRRQRAGVAEASFAASAAKRAQRNAQVSLEARLADFHAMAESAQRLVRLYDETLIPQAALTLESARTSYGVGRVDFLTTLTAFSALLEYRLRRTEEGGNLWRALAEIGPVVGQLPLGEPIASAP